VRHRAAASTVWEVPFGRGIPWGGDIYRTLDAVAGGWTLTGITTFATGQPVFLQAPIGAAGLYQTQLPNRVCDGRSEALAGDVRNSGFRWFDTSCFSLAQQGYF
jgi:hypothetical protein